MMHSTCATYWIIIALYTFSLYSQPFFFVCCVTIKEVAQHSAENDCWMVVDGTVYDVTSYAPNHPQRGWGSSSVYRRCGIDATDLYDQYHANEHDYLTSFSSIVTIGPVTTATSPPQTTRPTTRTPIIATPSPTNIQRTNPPVAPVTISPTTTRTTRPSTSPPSTAPPTTQPPVITTVPPTHNNDLSIVTSTELAQHNTENDCWVSYFDTVYDVTEYAPTHPAGPSMVYTGCGKNDTDAYAQVHPRSYLDSISQWIVGTYSPVNGDPTPAPTETNGNQPTTSDLTWSTVSTHNGPDDCWVVYYGTVYDVTQYAPAHPVGPEIIYEDCGKDGTDHYAIFHPQSLLSTIQGYALGNVTGEPLDTGSKSPNPVPLVITMEEVALHNTSSDCWVRFYDEVYDLTYYSHPPPGQSVILDKCGMDGTSDYVSVHPRDFLKKVEKHYLGKVSGSFNNNRIALSLCLGVLVSGMYFV